MTKIDWHDIEKVEDRGNGWFGVYYNGGFILATERQIEIWKRRDGYKDD